MSLGINKANGRRMLNMQKNRICEEGLYEDIAAALWRTVVCSLTLSSNSNAIGR